MFRFDWRLYEVIFFGVVIIFIVCANHPMP